MKKFIKEWLLPPKVKKLFASYYSLLKLRKFDIGIIKKNKEIKNKYKGKRCFILGNAPTINDIDITLLENEYVFVMSTFYNHPDYDKLKNTIFSTVHLIVFNENEEFNWLKTMNDNSKSTDVFFFNIAQKNAIEKNNFFSGKKIYYIATADIERTYNISKITENYQTNIIQALEIAIYMGFTEIYMHSVNINTICNSGKYDYFFDRKLLATKDPNMGIGDFVHDFFNEIESTCHALKEINKIKEFADEKGVKIYYTNQESLLKFFEFIPFSKIVKSNLIENKILGEAK